MSCEHSASKRTGALYDVALKNLNLKPEEVLMIGDNLWSDVFSARKRKISAKWVFKPYHSKSRRLRKLKHKLFVPKEYKAIFEENGRHYNYSNYAFPMYIFAKRLCENLQRNGTKNVFFMAREGHFLKTIFDEYCAFRKIDIKSHYFEISRNSILSPTLKPIEQENFDFILSVTRMMKPRSFLRSMSFTEAQVEEILASVKINPTRLYRNFIKSKDFKVLKNSPVFVRYYEEMRLNEAKNFQIYLDSFDVDYKNEGMHVVDVGWRGTIQNILKAYFEQTNQDINLQGYYIGYFKKSVVKRNGKIGIMYSKILSKVWGESRVYRYRMRDYEQLLRAPKPRTAGYNADRPYVRYAEGGNDEEFHQKVVAPMQQQILEKFRKICELDSKIYSNIDSISAQMYYKLIKGISLEDYKYMNACQNNFVDSFGYYGHTLRFDLKLFKWLYFRFRDVLYLGYTLPIVKRKKIYWH